MFETGGWRGRTGRRRSRAGGRRQESQGREAGETGSRRQEAGEAGQEGPGPGARICSQKEFLGKAVKKKIGPNPDLPEFYFPVKQIWAISRCPIYFV